MTAFATTFAFAANPHKNVSVNISPTSATLTTGVTQQFTATVSGAGNGSVNWLVNGTAGGNSTVGTISSSGLYTAPASVPSGSITVTAQSVANTSKSASASVTVTKPSAPAVTTASLPAATVNVAYSTTLAGSGGATPYTWSLASGSLPSGISLASNGTLSGTPTVTGSFAITVKLTDAIGQTASANQTLSVSPGTSGNAAKFFAPSSFINTALPLNPPIDPNSGTMVTNSLAAQASQAHLSNDSYGIALVYSSSSDKVYSVACTIYDSNTCLVGSSINFPIPKGATPPTGSDHNTAFIYTANDGSPYAGMELDCWVAQYNATNDSWSCGTASLVHNNTSTAWGTCAEANITSYHCNGGYAAGIDFAAGPVRPEEIQAGVIPHALVVAISNPGPGIVCPATHTDASGSAIPEGGHFFLPASYNVDAQSWPVWVKIVAKALQNYGGYVADYGGSFEVKGFTDKNPGSISWASVGVPVDGWSDLAQIPWNQMQVVTMQSCN